MAILLPSLQRVKRDAKSIACQPNLRQWGIAFAAEKEKLLYENPGQWWRRFGPLADKSSHGTCKDLLLCPMATKPGFHPYTNNIGYYGSKFSAWSLWGVVGSYGWSGQADHRALAYNNISNIPILFDCALPFAAFWSSDNPPPKYENLSIADADDDDPGSRICINRHDGGINMLFMDYSTRKVGLKELWTLQWNERFNKKGPWTRVGGVKPEDWPKWMRGFKEY